MKITTNTSICTTVPLPYDRVVSAMKDIAKEEGVELPDLEWRISASMAGCGNWVDLYNSEHSRNEKEVTPESQALARAVEKSR